MSHGWSHLLTDEWSCFNTACRYLVGEPITDNKKPDYFERPKLTIICIGSKSNDLKSDCQTDDKKRMYVL